MRQEISIPRDDAADIPGILQTSDANPLRILVLAHGAGAGMSHRFMEAFAGAVVEAGVAVLRYEFPYMTEGRKRPDVPAKLTKVVRGVVEYAKRRYPEAFVFAGGKSLGGRMTSTADSQSPLGVAGIVFVGFPLHAPGREGVERAAHLSDVAVPMLFLQGTRDRLAEIGRMRSVVTGLRDGSNGDKGAAVHLFEVLDADHSFHVPKRTGMTDEEVVALIATEAASWIAKVADG